MSRARRHSALEPPAQSRAARGGSRALSHPRRLHDFTRQQAGSRSRGRGTAGRNARWRIVRGRGNACLTRAMARRWPKLPPRSRRRPATSPMEWIGLILQQEMAAGAARNALDCPSGSGGQGQPDAGLEACRTAASAGTGATAFTLFARDGGRMGDAARSASAMPLLKLKLGAIRRISRGSPRCAAMRRTRASSSTPTKPGRSINWPRWRRGSAHSGSRSSNSHCPPITMTHWRCSTPRRRWGGRILPWHRQPGATEGPLSGRQHQARQDRRPDGSAPAQGSRRKRRVRIMVGCMVATSLAMPPPFCWRRRGLRRSGRSLLLERDREDGIAYDGAWMQGPSAPCGDSAGAKRS